MQFDVKPVEADEIFILADMLEEKGMDVTALRAENNHPYIPTMFHHLLTIRQQYQLVSEIGVDVYEYLTRWNTPIYDNDPPEFACDIFEAILQRFVRIGSWDVALKLHDSHIDPWLQELRLTDHTEAPYHYVQASAYVVSDMLLAALEHLAIAAAWSARDPTSDVVHCHGYEPPLGPVIADRIMKMAWGQ